LDINPQTLHTGEGEEGEGAAVKIFLSEGGEGDGAELSANKVRTLTLKPRP